MVLLFYECNLCLLSQQLFWVLDKRFHMLSSCLYQMSLSAKESEEVYILCQKVFKHCHSFFICLIFLSSYKKYVLFSGCIIVFLFYNETLMLPSCKECCQTCLNIFLSLDIYIYMLRFKFNSVQLTDKGQLVLEDNIFLPSFVWI